MTKVLGPMHSDDASGSYAGSLVFSKWKGRNYVRQLVTPVNRNTEEQKTVRSILGTIARACTGVLTSAKDTLNVGSQFFIDAVAKAFAGQSWISTMQKVLNPEFAGLVTAYGALSATIKGYYSTGASSVPLSDYTDKMDVFHQKGELLYILASYAVSKLGYTGFATGIDTASEAEVTAFVTYVNTTV